jgi:iron complex transport system substrate-binding protein
MENMVSNSSADDLVRLDQLKTRHMDLFGGFDWFLQVLRWVVFTATLLIVTACGDTELPVNAPDSAAPARRIVTLAPHLAELVYAAGAGEYLIGVSEFTDYPADTSQIPRIGDAFRVDYEQLSRLNPDLVLTWPSGNPPEIVNRIRELGYRVIELEPESLDDIGAQILLIGNLARTEATASKRVTAYQVRLQELRRGYAGVSGLTVFYQLSANPFFTVNGTHIISEILSLCGGDNIFADLDGLAPAINIEAIIAANPEVIIAPQSSSVQQSHASTWQEDWRRWPGLVAVRGDNLYSVNWDAISRSGPRILDAAEEICSALDTARSNYSRNSVAQ